MCRNLLSIPIAATIFIIRSLTSASPLEDNFRTCSAGRHSFSYWRLAAHRSHYSAASGQSIPAIRHMTNFRSPLDPIFFLHHANIDRLWDV